MVMLSLKQMLDATLVKPVIVSDYSSQVLLKPDNEYQEEVDLAIELQKKRVEIDDQLDAIKVSLRLQYIKTGKTKLQGTQGTITVSVPEDCEPYMNDDFDVVVATNNFSSTKLQKLVNKLIKNGKTSRRTMERCRSKGTRKISLSFPRFK
tara:strand:- start:589 stop:1038 length:450 start_codon:yes stop_codon:yes gene_type:complete